jgi:short-subunit dehydrogenase
MLTLLLSCTGAANNPARMQIQNRVVLITGASEGIGAACAKVFRERGARLSLTSRSEDKLRAVAGADALVTAGDITVAATRRRAVEATLGRFGRIDILINNAGAGLYSPAWSTTEERTRALFELNLFAPLALAQLVAPHMRQQRAGMIVNVGSIAGRMTLPWFTLYSVSKYALGSLTEGLRMELKRDGIHAMTVCPGYVDTGFQAHILGGQVPAVVARSRRFAITAGQCAEAIARGVERNARTVVTPRTGWFLIAIARLLPGLMEAQLEKIYARQHAFDAAGVEAP